ncbi:MAG: hypothetical protein KF887_14565 [Paracoccaceae bacterium]|nr:MAG: hypothetical protein KF887_14565 [Paracoccaceae bacterium]
MTGTDLAIICAVVAGVLALRRIALSLLHRFAPPWAVGPGGLLIDTRGRLGLFQMQQDPRHRGFGDGSDSDPGGGRCD